MDELCRSLLKEFDDPDRYAGVLLFGSTARGDAGPFSDVDLVFYTREEIEDERERYQLAYRENRLISLTRKTVDEARGAFTKPQEAIGSVQGFKDAIVLRDSPQGEMEELKKLAKDFTWTEELKQVANLQASYHLMGFAEEVHKVLSGLRKKDKFGLLNGAWGLALNMPIVIGLTHHVMATGENIFWRQVQESVGIDSRWTELHDIAIGASADADADVHLELRQLTRQAIAAVQLYDETARIVDGILTPEDKIVVDTAIRIAFESGLIPA